MYIISSMGHSRLDSVGLLVLWTVAYINCVWTSILYYKSLGIAPTLLKMSNILGRPYMIVMTYKTLVFCIKILRRLQLEVHNFFVYKTILLQCLNIDNTSCKSLPNCMFNSINWFMSYPTVSFTY
jgi:hypothetical protein